MIIINFRKWLEASGGSGGVGSGIHPPKQKPLLYKGALPDYHSKSGTDPSNQNGKLPPVSKESKKRKYWGENPTTYMGKEIKELK